MDEDKLQRDIGLGHRAKALLDDDLLKAAFESLRLDFMQAWCATKGKEHDDREMLWCKVSVLDEVKHKLETLVSNGTVAQRKLNS
jgi:hypothetical protein